MSVLAYYDVYTSQGLKIIPLKDKKPIIKNWNKGFDYSKIRSYIADCKPNLGLMLGELIDVEGDTPYANKLIMGLSKTCPHPMWASSKSVHHLFLNPEPSMTILKHKGVEFRGALHHSVLPPSFHPNGLQYRWLKESRFPVPKMPYPLLSLFKEAKKGNTTKPNHLMVPCKQCNREYLLHSNRFQLELSAFKILGKQWTCKVCRTVDIATTCRRLKKDYRGRKSSS